MILIITASTQTVRHNDVYWVRQYCIKAAGQYHTVYQHKYTVQMYAESSTTET
jgi:hypothetical protein